MENITHRPPGSSRGRCRSPGKTKPRSISLCRIHPPLPPRADADMQQSNRRRQSHLHAPSAAGGAARRPDHGQQLSGAPGPACPPQDPLPGAPGAVWICIVCPPVWSTEWEKGGARCVKSQVLPRRLPVKYLSVNLDLLLIRKALQWVSGINLKVGSF